MDLVVTSQNWMKIDYNWPILTQKWDNIWNNGTGCNQWKVDNKIVKIQWNISLILKTNFDNKIQPFSMKSNENLANFWDKFIENQIKSCTTPFLKLIENQWKLIINSWKINEISTKF